MSPALKKIQGGGSQATVCKNIVNLFAKKSLDTISHSP
jgi:hypothetical protein